MRAELAATHKALRRVFESEEARWRVAVRRADDPAREAAEGGVFAALFPPCFPDLGAHVDGGGGHTVLKYGTLAERDSLAYKLVSAVQRDVNALGSAARGGAPKLTLEAAAAKLAAIATLEPETLRLEEPKCFRDFDANAFAGAREASATRSLATHTAAAAALLEMARAVGRLRPARRVLAAQLSNARDVCDAARLAPPAELIDAEGARGGRTWCICRRSSMLTASGSSGARTSSSTSAAATSSLSGTIRAGW